MAKKLKKNHLASEDSFRFALYMAVIAVLLAVMVNMLQLMGTNQELRTKAAQLESMQQ